MRSSKDFIIENNEEKMRIHDLLNEAASIIGKLQSEYHKHEVKVGSSISLNHNIFFSPIDEGMMGNCILKVKNDFFNYNDSSFGFKILSIS